MQPFLWCLWVDFVEGPRAWHHWHGKWGSCGAGGVLLVSVKSKLGLCGVICHMSLPVSALGWSARCNWRGCAALLLVLNLGHVACALDTNDALPVADG